jgi:hypothetical protein
MHGSVARRIGEGHYSIFKWLAPSALPGFFDLQLRLATGNLRRQQKSLTRRFFCVTFLEMNDYSFSKQRFSYKYQRAKDFLP